MKKVFALILIILLSNISTVFAADATSFVDLEAQLLPIIRENQQKLREAPVSECKRYITVINDAYTALFFKFLEANFENKSSNSSLKNIAIAKYKEYKRFMQDTLLLVQPKVTNEGGSQLTLSEEFISYASCADLTQSYIDLNKEMMIEHIRKTNAQKQTTVFVEKSRSINNQLANLNLQIAYMYAKFATFQNKLPGYIGVCVAN